MVSTSYRPPALPRPTRPTHSIRRTGALSIATRRPPRRRRTRRAEIGLLAVALVASWFGVRAAWPRVTGRPAPAIASAPLGGQAARAASGPQAVATPGSAASAQAAVQVFGPVLPGQMLAPAPPIAFSFAQFEADPALVAGAASTGAPNLSGDSAIVVDVTGRDVLYAKQPYKRQLMASTAKIMTGIVAVERGALDKVIVVPQEATEVEPNHMGIRAGEKLTLQELLYGMFLDSGNDAAEAVAIGVGGGGAEGRARFIGWMNEKAALLGLKDTRFANPAGLDDPNQYSSAYDLAVMGAYALGKPELKTIFGTKEIVISPSKEPGREHGWFNPGNLNSLLWSYRGALGIKPGYTEDAGYTLVGAAERDGRTLICVTLNSRRHFGDCTALLDFGFKRAAQPPATPAAQPAA